MSDTPQPPLASFPTTLEPREFDCPNFDGDMPPRCYLRDGALLACAFTSTENGLERVCVTCNGFTSKIDELQAASAYKPDII